MAELIGGSQDVNVALAYFDRRVNELVAARQVLAQVNLGFRHAQNVLVFLVLLLRGFFVGFLGLINAVVAIELVSLGVGHFRPGEMDLGFFFHERKGGLVHSPGWLGLVVHAEARPQHPV